MARLGVEPLWAGLGLGVLLVTIPWAIEAAEGHVALILAGELASINLRAPTVAMLVVGLAPAAELYRTRWTARHLREIAALVQGGLPGVAPTRPSVWTGVLGAGVLALLFGVPTADWAGYRDGTALTPHGLYLWPMVSLLGWCLGRFLETLLRDSLLVSCLAERIETIDLLDRGALRLVERQGLRGALVMVALLSLTAVISVSPGRTVVGALIATSLNLAMAVVALVLPARGIHRRIRVEKERQIAPLRAEIDAARRRVTEGAASAEQVARLPGLLALEARLDAVREWPFDTGSLSRFALYLLLGLGSWFGAAGVELLLGWGLGGS